MLSGLISVWRSYPACPVGQLVNKWPRKDVPFVLILPSSQAETPLADIDQTGYGVSDRLLAISNRLIFSGCIEPMRLENFTISPIPWILRAKIGLI